MRCPKAICGTVLVSFIVSSATLFASPMYMIQNLGVVDGSASIGTRLNNSGQVVGYDLSVVAKPIVFDGTGAHLLEVPDGTDSASVFDINDAGQILGLITYSVGVPQMVLWDATTRQIVSPPSQIATWGMAINNAGQLAGGIGVVNSSHAAIFDSSSFQQLNALDAFGWSNGLAINNLGQVVGYHGPDGLTAITSPRGFYWDGSTVIDIGTLGGSLTVAADINDSGLVTGSSRNASGYDRAFIWDGATMHDLGALGGQYSSGRAINRFGHVTGETGGGAFIWDGSGMIDLNTILVNGDGWELFEGSDINDRGQITGQGYYRNELRAFLLTPVSDVPEPGSRALTLTGIVSMLAFMSARRYAGRSGS